MSTNHYYKGNRLSAYGGYMLGSGHYYGESTSSVKYLDANGDAASVWKSNEKTHYRATSQNTMNLNLEYQIDSLNTVTVGGNAFFSLKSTATINTPTYIYNSDGVLDSLYVTKNHRDYPQKNNTLNGSFEHKFKTGKLILMADHTSHYFNQGQGVNALFSLPGQQPYRSQLISSEDNRRIRLFSAQADYNGQMKGFNVETGLRFGSVDAKNDFEFAEEINGVPANTPDLSNKFLYDEAVYAGYFGLDREFGKWGLKAGLRGEYTVLEGNSVTMSEVNKQEYFRLFPTLYALYKASDNHQIGASYGKRISRPPYAFLNPFRSYNTPYSYSTGDPQLQPAIMHNFSLMYTLNSKYNFDLYYRFEKDPAMEIGYQDYASNTVITQITNIEKNTVAGLQFNTNIEVKPWWAIAVQAGGGYQETTFQGANGDLYLNKKWNFGIYASNQLTLDKAKTWMAESSFWYSSPGAQGSYVYGGVSSLSASVRKTFMKGNGQISLILSDIYRGEKQTITMRYANQDTYAKTYNDTQSLRIQFLYRFGNQRLSDKERREADEKQRL